MKINISELKKQIGSTQDFSIEMPSNSLAEYPWIDGNVYVNGTLINTGTKIEASGKISFNAKLICVKCLKGFISNIEVSFNEFYNEQICEDSEYFTYTGDLIDLSEMLHEAIVISEPMAPTCAESCKGFCGVCGVNLSEKQCNCESEKIDHRLAILKQLL